MRTAILYAGQLRSWNRGCRENQETMIKGDTYFFTTEDPGKPYAQFIKDYPRSYYPDPLSDYDQNKNPITQLNGTQNQWRGMWMSFNLVPVDYDCYCKSRPDIQILAPINFEDYDLKDDTVYVPQGNDHCDGINDQFAFGNYQSLKKYFSIFTEHHKLYAKGLVFHTEYFLTENLKAQGVEIIRIPQTTTIIR